MRSSLILMVLHVSDEAVHNEHPGRFKSTANDDACFKLWNVYISQAHDYDKALLLEGWKGDMDGMPPEKS
ncbi:hypothetical protein D9758_006294 [Tetrapyrgos nigripes]|uniref:Uncharacterized protein n=1 Tax=Tetrapyrgos nigripes TaxID=182062 RepID=A0A8H5DA52_9AGAR|nr:hypothetical protein D9758_006294 [Tetrapyrgos nigripes]